MTENGFRDLLVELERAGVEFILIGGLAAVVHGSSRATVDVDVVYRRSRENMERLVSALQPFAPYLRGVPPGLPFRFDLETLESGLNFTLITQIGDIDLLAEVPGNGTWETLEKYSKEIEIFGAKSRVISLPKLIELKIASGRPKDIEAIAELQAIQRNVDNGMNW
ncbi:MAG: hypothetical protein KF851_04830 [Pirellulaceae bacterium]|jgi:predicted nucleotidyltransferase|nr:hypothetical protein [Pirellulaceae bacterium]